MDILDRALAAAAALALRVFPLEPLSATPAVANWQEVATTDPAVIAAWFAERPINYGILTGAPSDLFVVELTGEAARHWWRSRGFDVGMKVAVPSGPDQTHLYFRAGGVEVASRALRDGIRICGERDFVPGPGSMLSTGTFRGDFDQLSVANFDPSVDFEGEWGAMLPLLEVARLLPESMSTGERFLDQIIGRSENRRTAEPHAIRARLLTEALRAGLSAQQALSVAWASVAGRELHEAPDGEEQIRVELAAARTLQPIPDEDGASFGGPRRVTLLTADERKRVAATSWWGTRYVEWGSLAYPGSTPFLHEHYRWVVLSRVFTGQGFIPKIRGTLSLDVREAVLSDNVSAVEVGKEAMTSLLQAVGVERVPPVDISDVTKRLAKAGTSFEGTPAAGGSVLSRLGADLFAQYVWTVDLTLTDGLTSAEQRQHQSVPTPWRLITDLDDAREKLRLALGEAPVAIYMEPEALERHVSFKAALSEVQAGQPSLEASLLGLADMVWKCATLAAMAGGFSTVLLEHELIALEQAETWLGNAVWLNEQTETTRSPHRAA